MKYIFKTLILVMILSLMLTSCLFRDADSGSDNISVGSIGTSKEHTDDAVKDTTDVTDPQPETDEAEEVPVDSDTDVMTEAVPEEVTTEQTPVTEPLETEPIVTEPASTETETPSQPSYDPNISYRPKALMYHLIREDVYGIYENLFVKPTEFEKQLTLLDSLGYEYLFAEEWQIKNNPTVIVTLDDGYLDNYTDMFPILKAHGAKATVFIVTELIGTDGYMTRDMIKEMSDSGLVSFQCHTVNHRSLSSLSADSVRYEVEEASRIIEEITGKPVKAIAYPAGEFNDTVLSVVSESFDFAYTTKSPYIVTEYTDLTVPRYYMGRYLTIEQFKGMVG